MEIEIVEKKMEAKEVKKILRDIITFVCSAEENGVNVMFSYTPIIQCITMYVRTENDLNEDFHLFLRMNNFNEASGKLKDYITKIVDKYYPPTK